MSAQGVALRFPHEAQGALFVSGAVSAVLSTGVSSTPPEGALRPGADPEVEAANWNVSR
jgi:hypothetical protein